jgi:transposase
MPNPNDLRRSLAPLEQESTLIAVIEMSQSSWLVPGIVPGIDRHPLKKLEASEAPLLGGLASPLFRGKSTLRRWQDEAVKTGHPITRIAVAFTRWQFSASVVTIAPFNDSIFSSSGTAVISLDLASVAICANTSRCSQPQALTMCKGDLPLARSNDRRRTSIYGHYALTLLGKPRHETLKSSLELYRIELPEQSAALRQAQEDRGWARRFPA